ncbi:MAG: glycoside hydrolase family 3 N-terminal domain-containing protein, partial [Candidatus Wallbacteria bacterium]|nr:glycoside hydrolase family 3 N-terminal domain-containing protein [Candidatus Wallbacteria bacterium]
MKVTLLTMLMVVVFGFHANECNCAPGHQKLLLQNMTLDEKIGQMIMLDLPVNDDAERIRTAKERIRTVKPGGVILFAKDLGDDRAIIRLTDAIRKFSPIAPLISVDQEGGRVTRILRCTNFPGNMALGATGNPKFAYESGRIIARELSALGFNLNFAPVVDVNVNPENPVIDIRSFSEDPETVAEFGSSYMAGLHRERIISTAKHFPGHGDTAVDSHMELPTIPHGIDRVERVELVPFARLIKDGVDMIMTAHVTFPGIDSTTVISRKTGGKINLPATLSEPILTGLLREKMGFSGVIVTDAFNMKAIADHFGENEAVIRAIMAGADMILMPSDPASAVSAIREQVLKGRISENRIDQSVARILALKAEYGLLDTRIDEKPFDMRVKRAERIVAGRTNLLTEKLISNRSVTLLRNIGGILPFENTGRGHLLLLAPDARLLDMMKSASEKCGIALERMSAFVYRGKDLTANAERIRKAMGKDVSVVLGTHNLGRGSVGKSDLEDVNSVLGWAFESGAPVAALMIRTPYDAMLLPSLKAIVAVYGSDKGPNIDSGMAAIFGLVNPSGKLPVSMPHPDGKGILFSRGFGMKYDEAYFDHGQSVLVKPGIDFIDEYEHLFRGKRVGLVTNPSGVDSSF